MRVAFPPGYKFPSATPASIPVVPLSPEVSKALIASNVFQHDPRGTVFAAPGLTALQLGAPIKAPVALPLAGGLTLHPYSHPSHDALFTVLQDLGEKCLPAAETCLPFLEQAQLPIADEVALLVAAPSVFAALTRPDMGTGAKCVILGSNALKALKVVNQFAPIPHIGDSLEIVATVFKLGEDVVVSGFKTPNASR